MLKKLITYTDYNGVERKENHYFNLNKTELLEMETEVAGGMRQLIENMMEKQDIPKIMKSFKTILLKAYGEKSPDGRRFIKSEELSTAFSQTEAYNVLFMELLSDAGKAAAFINGLMPDEMRGEVPPEGVLTPITKKEEPVVEEDADAHLSGT